MPDDGFLVNIEKASDTSDKHGVKVMPPAMGYELEHCLTTVEVHCCGNITGTYLHMYDHVMTH